jgi:halimadienyl-diphosphate synthase
MLNIEVESQKLLEEIGPGHMSSTAYDTAWVARLGEIDWELSNRAMEWLCENQLPDGSWGAKNILYYHDRVISTLAAMIALTHRGRRARDKYQIEKGLMALESITSGATQGLASDPNGATVGFEMFVPTLVAEAEKLGIIKRQGEKILGRLTQLRNRKLANINGKVINKNLTMAFSAEMAGSDGQHMLDIDNLQETNGAVANSPSATAYFSLLVKPHDQSALKYLNAVVKDDGGLPNVAPFDVFEVAWTLWNLRLTGNDLPVQFIQRHLDFLERSWQPNRGIGFASDYSVKDGDDTGLVYDALSRFHRKMDIESILAYEEESFYRCYSLESNPSISANIHVLGALRQAGFAPSHSSVKKVLNFLKSSMQNTAYWIDKWHSSPYYATAHAVIACAGYADEVVEDSVKWLLSKQQSNGAWGVFSKPTAEETAYAVQSLCIWVRAGNKIPAGRIEHGAKWLDEHMALPYEPLWIGKVLYCPELVIRSAVLSAIQLARETRD